MESYKNTKNFDSNFSEMQLWRREYKPTLPALLKQCQNLITKTKEITIPEDIKAIFSSLYSKKPELIEFIETKSSNSEAISVPLRIGVVLSGGQAAGGHNVIAGVYDYVKNIHPSSQLFGFLDGPIGIYTGKYEEINDEFMLRFRNQGGFDMIRSGRHKIETPEQFADSMKHCSALKLDGLIVIGGDDSNTNACLLAEYFSKNNCSTTVVGVPKTIDGDLKNEYIEVSFGYDTATKLFSELIGNICLDTLSSKKYYHFIRLMGRSASHISLECGLLTQVNLVLVGEEVQSKNQTLNQIVEDLFDMIIKRSQDNKNYGVILIPEGLIEFIPEINILIKEINEIVSKLTNCTKQEIEDVLLEKLSKPSLNVYNFLPKSISEQLLLDRDPHGNVQVSKIDTEKLLILLVQEKIVRYNDDTNHKIHFSPQSHFFGYEGRCALPSVFDTEYCYSLGFNAGLLVNNKLNGYMSIIRGLKELNPENWVPSGCPLMSMMNIERRKGKEVPVIKKALVELDGDMYKAYQKVRDTWKYNDSYSPVGPIQYEGENIFKCPYLVYTPNADEIDLKKYITEKETPSSVYAPKNINNFNSLSDYLYKQEPVLPKLLSSSNPDISVSKNILDFHHDELLNAIKRDFSNVITTQFPSDLAEVISNSTNIDSNTKSLRIGIIFNGRQAPGGNNVVKGLLEFKKKFNNDNFNIDLLGFKYGTLGFFKEEYITITEDNFKPFLNQGGYDYLGRSVDKIRTEEEKAQAGRVCTKLNLDGLILVGATHTLSDALILSEYFLKDKINTKVITVPSTVDGNVSHPMFESTLGFDTASKVYSGLIGNIMTDAASNTKYWYFIRLMGRNPSHLVLECALQTHPNYVIISEEIAKNGLSLMNVVSEISDIICERAKNKKNFGTVLIPEGFISYIPYFSGLIEELNKLFSPSNREFLKKIDFERVIKAEDKDLDYLKTFLSPWSAAYILYLPVFIRKQLLFERESNGGLQLSQIETEKLIAYCVSEELAKRKKEGKYLGSFSSICHFFGYQGRSSHPSVLDANLAVSYGYTACLLIKKGVTAYCVTAKGLNSNTEDWILGGIPLTSMCSLKSSSTYGVSFAHISSSDVSLDSKAFLELKSKRRTWVTADHFRNPGPIQYYNFGKNEINLTVKLNYGNYRKYITEIEKYCNKIRLSSNFGVKEEILQATLLSLENLDKMLKVINTSNSK